jgi:ribonuclease HI
MSVRAPHFLLFSESRSKPLDNHRAFGTEVGWWRFVLKTVDGTSRLEASDEETEAEVERLELLAVVRGLEALDQPSRVTLVTPSRYVSRGFRFGLEQWRENDWRWECFGEMIPIKNDDLWRRVDRAMQFHQVECRTWRIDTPEKHGPKPAALYRRASSQRRRTRVVTKSRQNNAAFPTRLVARFVGLCRGSRQGSRVGRLHTA